MNNSFDIHPDFQSIKARTLSLQRWVLALMRYLLALAPGLSVQHAQAGSERLQRESPARRHNLWPREPHAVLPLLQQWLGAQWSELAPVAQATAPAGVRSSRAG